MRAKLVAFLLMLLLALVSGNAAFAKHQPGHRGGNGGSCSGASPGCSGPP